MRHHALSGFSEPARTSPSTKDMCSPATGNIYTELAQRKEPHILCVGPVMVERLLHDVFTAAPGRQEPLITRHTLKGLGGSSEQRGARCFKTLFHWMRTLV